MSGRKTLALWAAGVGAEGATALACRATFCPCRAATWTCNAYRAPTISIAEILVFEESTHTVSALVLLLSVLGLLKLSVTRTQVVMPMVRAGIRHSGYCRHQ